MSESLFETLIEISWRRKLTPEEEVQLQSWLASHPADADRWETEAGLNLALDRLEPIKAPSNFTRGVLQRIELERRASLRQKATWWDRVRGMLAVPKIAWVWTTAVLVVSGVGYHQYREHSHGQVAQGMQSFTTVAAATAPEVLADFDAIREFSHVRAEVNQTDEALFVLLGQ